MRHRVAECTDTKRVVSRAMAEKDLRAAFRVTPGAHVRLAQLDPSDFQGWKKPAAEKETPRQMERLEDLQDRFWAQAKRGVLVILQGIDASGKDGSIKHVMTAFNPQGSYVASFKVPSLEEASHDFLWRVHKRAPAKGEIGIFNRSHYEEVLVVRVHELVPKAVWQSRYRQIMDWERMLTETGTTIVKFFLHIDRDEQRKRLQERYENPRKRWKFSPGDIEERKMWDDYMGAYEDALSRTSTSDSPWYVIPANRNWFRNLAISTILADTLAELKPDYPDVELPRELTIT